MILIHYLITRWFELNELIEINSIFIAPFFDRITDAHSMLGYAT